MTPMMIDILSGDTGDPRRIAVLYFDDLSENQDAGHIAAGLTETLIHELAQVGSLAELLLREVPLAALTSHDCSDLLGCAADLFHG